MNFIRTSGRKSWKISLRINNAVGVDPCDSRVHGYQQYSTTFLLRQEYEGILGPASLSEHILARPTSGRSLACLARDSNVSAHMWRHEHIYCLVDGQ